VQLFIALYVVRVAVTWGGHVRPQARHRLRDGTSGVGCDDAGMAIDMRPATNFDDVAAMVGPKRPDANVCWCLSYRIPSKDNLALHGAARGERVRQLVQQDPPPGVLAYDGEEVVGWAAVHPRADTSFARNRTIPRLDELDVWSLWCIRVRPGHRGTGIAHHLVEGAVALARARGAPVIEGYPVDNDGRTVDLTMAYVGTRQIFQRAGFVKVADTGSVVNGFPRVLMRLDLRC
jgi:GNAT superfamily N-acetyltransferase